MVALSLIVDKECRQLKTIASGVKVDINFTFALREGRELVCHERSKTYNIKLMLIKHKTKHGAQ